MAHFENGTTQGVYAAVYVHGDVRGTPYYGRFHVLVHGHMRVACP